jgi:hypothetical protein
VVTQTGGGAGASTLILAAVTAFYDRLRATEADFFAYPDYFAFHVGRPRGSLRKLDVYPEHKEPVVPDDAEAILEAINDRGITHLLVPDRPVAPGAPGAPGAPAAAAAAAAEAEAAGAAAAARTDRETRHSAQRRIRTVIAYSPAGRVPAADITITAAAQAEEFVTAMLGDGPRDVVGSDGRPRETFRRLALDDAFGMLGTRQPEPPPPAR